MKAIELNANEIKELIKNKKVVLRRKIEKKYSNTEIKWLDSKRGRELVEMQNDIPKPIKVDGGAIHKIAACCAIEIPYRNGEELWVKEKFYIGENEGCNYNIDADYREDMHSVKWTEAANMKRNHSRFNIIVAKINAEFNVDVESYSEEYSESKEYQAKQYYTKPIWEWVLKCELI